MNSLEISDVSPVMRSVLRDGGTVCMHPKGESMRQFIRACDEVILSQVKMPPKRGHIYLFSRQNGSFVLHRCVSIRSDGLVFRGDNQRKKEYGILPSQLFGEVVSVKRAGKVIVPGSWWYCFYACSAVPVFYFRTFLKLMRKDV